jgi:FKBP-type peptidyl-prolyl cis-trans isomerase FklB
MKQILAMILGMTLLIPICRAGDQNVSLEDQKPKDSYSLGYEFGANLKRRGVEVDVEVLLASIREGLEGKQPAISAEEIERTLKQLKKKAMILSDRRFNELTGKNLEESKAFLGANKMKEDVKTLPSGLQYRVLREGNGPVPQAADSVELHYRGTQISGKEFDSSYRRGGPSTVPLVGVIKGWTEALQLMKVGSKWEIFVPPDLGYGTRWFGRIPPNSALIFELELLSIKDSPLPKAIQNVRMGAGGETGEARDQDSESCND